MSYSIFDLHWHGRDKKQAYKETLKRSLEVAEASGVVAVAFMPNTDEPLISLDRCNEYLVMADACGSSVKTYVHIGLTPDIEQVKRAVEATRKQPRIIGMKAYWGKSVGDLTIEKKDEQHKVLETLAREGYDGVLASHCEKESEMKDGLYEAANPITWSLVCRPESAETASFDDIVSMAENVKFRGKIHVCHVSTVYVVDRIDAYTGPLALSCGVTPHHLLFNNSVLNGSEGAQYKCNPPLRSRETQKGLLSRLMSGKIPIVESDHAPHSQEDKCGSKPASGIASGCSWPYITDELVRLGVSDEVIDDAVFNNPLRLYGISVERSGTPVDWDKLARLQHSYPFDHFKWFKLDRS